MIQGVCKMVGQRGGNLRACWEEARTLCSEVDLVAGIQQARCAMFLDFVVMWLAGYPRSAVFLELEEAGAGKGLQG